MLRLETEAVLVVVELPEDAPARVAQLTANGTSVCAARADRLQPLVEVLVLGEGHMLSQMRYTNTAVGARLRVVSHEWAEQGKWQELRVLQRDSVTGLEVTSVLTVHPDAAAVRAWTSVSHTGSEPLVLQAVTSFATAALLEGDEAAEELVLWRARADWCAEGRWAPTDVRSPDGLADINTVLHNHDGRGTLGTTSHSTWSSGEFVPTAVLENRRTGRSWAWQIEHNGPWHWELDSRRAGADALCLLLLGPTDVEHQWSHQLLPGATFTTVPVAVAVGSHRGGVEGALASMTDYRRVLRRTTAGDAHLPVIFNDYMNTLMGDPTTAKLLPLIDAAAEAGAEIFCIDAGWYDDGGTWWDSVGEWQPSKGRFPGGLQPVLDHIRDRGMSPGLWLEPEVVGVRSPMADTLPTEAFLQRYGRRVVEHSRYHLDLRHPAARQHLDSVVDRLVDDFGVTFFKLDYNVTPGAGTDLGALSPGDGLLGHNRAHLAWLDAVLDRHPHVVFENCASGAMRMDYAMLARLSLQSTSDQQDGLLYAAVAAGAPASVLPEQAGNWAYPKHGDGTEAAAFTLLNGLAGRLYLSGHLNHFSPAELSLVCDAVALYKQLRGELASSHPFWPLGLPGWDDEHVALGLRRPDGDLLYVWARQGTSAEINLDLASWRGRRPTIETIFPVSLPPWGQSWNQETGQLSLQPSAGIPSGRLLKVH